MSSTIPIVWADAAKKDIANQTAADYGGVAPEKFHEDKVEDYWKANSTDSTIKDANKARIRRGAHTGGSDDKEKDHITVSFRKGSNELATSHVYTGR